MTHAPSTVPEIVEATDISIAELGAAFEEVDAALAADPELDAYVRRAGYALIVLRQRARERAALRAARKRRPIVLCPKMAKRAAALAAGLYRVQPKADW